MDAVKVGRWKVGYDHRNKVAVVVLEFSDREPIALAIEKDDAPRIGRALIDINTEGTPSPARPS